jgi:hypothetical protein
MAKRAQEVYGVVRDAASGKEAFVLHGIRKVRFEDVNGKLCVTHTDKADGVKLTWIDRRKYVIDIGAGRGPGKVGGASKG